MISDFDAPTLLPRIQHSPTRSPHTPSTPETSQQQTAFYAGDPKHCHTYETSTPELPSRPRMRMRPSPTQTEELRKSYMDDPHPTKDVREALGKRIGMSVNPLPNSVHLTHSDIGAIRVSLIGFKISEVLQRNDRKMTPSLTERSTLTAVASHSQTRLISCLILEIGRPLRCWLSPRDLLTRPFLL